MYLQIRIPPEDRPKFSFLWRNLEVDRDPDVYEFKRVVFGDASAPFRAQFVSQENARIHEEKFPLAAETVIKSTYMDDSLHSTRDNVSAVQLFHQLQGLWDKAVMKARNIYKLGISINRKIFLLKQITLNTFLSQLTLKRLTTKKQNAAKA